MSDLFSLFDGKINAGGAAAIAGQTDDSFSSVSSENDLVSTLASGSDSVELLVDYSDFSNFVTFNSAESYATITADQILNSYPIGGTVDDLQVFINSLDGYQKYFLSLWPSRVGHLRLDPSISSSYVRYDDFGVQNGTARTSFLSPGTGSLTVQGWIDVPVLTGSNDAQVIFQKQINTSTDGYTVFVSGTLLWMQVISGSTIGAISGSIAGPSFFACTIDRSAVTASLALYVGTSGTYPVKIASSPMVLGARFDLASGSFFIGSGSIASRSVIPFTGSLDSMSVWSVPRSVTDMSGTYNRKVFAQSGLIASWQFNDATTLTPSSFGSIVHDRSGHRLDGRIQRFFANVLGSGSLSNDIADPILSLDDPTVISYVVAAQVSGALYDRNNQSLIFNLFPETFTPINNPTSAEIFRNFALILARQYDRIKLYINQLVNLRRVSYDDYDQAPDELLDEVGRFFGWELQGNFANADALKYFIGRNIQPGPLGNVGLGDKLSDIKASFWRRMLLNLMYVYKTKGTGESVNALLRAHGVDNGFVRLKEYARKTETRLIENRVSTEKSVYVMQFMSGASVSLSGR